jgi:hypothetical protein
MAAPKSRQRSIRVPKDIDKEIERMANDEKRDCSWSSMAIHLWKKVLKMK